MFGYLVAAPELMTETQLAATARRTAGCAARCGQDTGRYPA
ncbi:MAG: hypothetical protein V8S72_07425 [Oscillospiraceae bacterium]